MPQKQYTITLEQDNTISFGGWIGRVDIGLSTVCSFGNTPAAVLEQLKQSIEDDQGAATT